MRARFKLARITRILSAGALVFGVSAVALEAGFATGAAADNQPYYSWGLNVFGELGNGTDTGPNQCPPPSGEPCGTTPGAVALPGGAPSAIASAEGTGYAITSTGQIDSWGYNADGELGNGTTTDSSTPVAVNMPGGVTPIAIAGGQLDGYAIGSNNTLYAWGDNTLGELGTGSLATSSDTPVAVTLPGGATPVGVAGGFGDGYAIGSNGNLYAWGDNTDGQLGNGTIVSSSTPVQVSLPGGFTPQTVVAGDEFALCLGTNGTVLAWGNNAQGALGNGSAPTTTFDDAPVTVSLPAAATSIGAGYFTGYAIASSTLYAWGDNSGGSLGNGSDPTSVPYAGSPVSVSLPGSVAPVFVTGGSDSGYAIGAGGALFSWGVGDNGSLGNGTQGTNSLTPVSVSLPAGVEVGAVAAGLNDGFAIDAPPGSPIITSPNAVTFDSSQPNSFTVTATGNPTPNFAATGVPSGLTFTDNDNGTATLSGIPACSATGKYLISIEASNGSPRIPAIQTLTLTLNNPVVTPPVFYSANSDTITAGRPMMPFAVLTSCNPGMTITETGLPAGIRLSKVGLSHYTLTGSTKATVGGVQPAATFTAKGVYNGTFYSITQSFTLTVDQKPLFASVASQTVVAGATLDFTVRTLAYPALTSLTTTGTTPWMTFTQNAFPNANTGSLTGTVPTNVGGKFLQTFVATNSAGTAKQSFTLTVDLPPPAPTGPAARNVLHAKMMTPDFFHSPGYPTVHYAYTVVSAPDDPATLPLGVAFSPTYGKFSGTPAAGTQGTYVIDVVAENTFGSPATLHTSAPTTFTLTVT